MWFLPGPGFVQYRVIRKAMNVSCKQARAGNCKRFPKVLVCHIFSISALFPNYLAVHLVSYLDVHLCPGAAAWHSVFLHCVCTCRRGLAGDLAVSKRICGESSSHCFSDDTPLHMPEHMVGYTWLQAIRRIRWSLITWWRSCPPHVYRLPF